MHDHLEMAMDACDPRTSSDYTGMRGSGVNALLHQKELELHKLREISIRDLEEKVCATVSKLGLTASASRSQLYSRCNPVDLDKVLVFGRDTIFFITQLAKKEEDAQQALEQLYKLQEDFKYNLGLLDKRDAELHDLDEHMAVLAAELGRKDALLVDLHEALQLAQSGMTPGLLRLHGSRPHPPPGHILFRSCCVRP
jgi:hypothetical protein